MAATELSNLPASAVRVDGGYRVDGWWDYGSGCDTATHVIGAVAVVGADGQSPADTRWAAFPRAAYSIVDNWDTLCIRGTGSVERCFRDVNVIRTHVTTPFDRAFENIGQMRLGLPPAGFF
jgi:alkylation response protein AidB-like acyl-CoA dehydrogenase